MSSPAGDFFAKGKQIGALTLLLVIFLIVLNLTNFSREVKSFFYLISSPIQRTLWKAGDKTSDFFEVISGIKNLKKESEELKLKIQELLAENVALKELKKENEILRGALEIGLEKEFKLALARVIGKDIPQDLILIDKGTEDGILKGFPVITEQKILVGKISEAYKNFSKVMLLSHKESSFDGKIPAESETPIYGVVKGKGSFKLYLDLVPRDKEIKEGDLLVTTALGGIFPEGILVGEIEEVKKLDIEPFQQAEIKPAFDIKEIEKVFVITDYQ